MFGTFEPETERPVYGLTNNLTTHNPARIAFHEWAAMGRALRQASSLRNAVNYVFGPPGRSHDGSRKTTRTLREKP